MVQKIVKYSKLTNTQHTTPTSSSIARALLIQSSSLTNTKKVATTDSVELISLSVGVPDESISFCGADMKALVWIRVCGVVSSTGSGIIVPFSIICAVLDVSSIRSGVTKGTVESAADLAV
ncbi:hypothetical protein BLNAU_21572 [Blattamonas nauphoetae]|uniref:Uncharacterized protein n=1 Tax=Blattamonas nauphoetae TaxID=2049346 RepID=A0ABQ9WVZ6_9EUKA|nr:hypothetical protein BLNAU_21572 [Blattamonas nauphoetae]